MEERCSSNGRRCMYRKRFENFKHLKNYKPSTRRKQERRFQRCCRRVFKPDKQNECKSLEDKLAAGKRYRFLFLESQYVNKPIKHLKYKKSNALPDANDYNYLVPFFHFRLSARDRIITDTTNASSYSHVTPHTNTNITNKDDSKAINNIMEDILPLRQPYTIRYSFNDLYS